MNGTEDANESGQYEMGWTDALDQCAAELTVAQARIDRLTQEAKKRDELIADLKAWAFAPDAMELSAHETLFHIRRTLGKTSHGTASSRIQHRTGYWLYRWCRRYALDLVHAVRQKMR